MPPRLLPDCITLTSRVVNYIHIPLLMCPMPALPVMQPIPISQTFQNNTVPNARAAGDAACPDQSNFPE